MRRLVLLLALALVVTACGQPLISTGFDEL